MAVTEESPIAERHDARRLRVLPSRGGATNRRRFASVWKLRVVGDLTAVVVGTLVVSEPGPVHLVYAGATLALLGMLGTYRRRISLSVLDDVPRLLRPPAGALLVVAVASMFADVPASLFRQALATVAGIVALRAVSYAVINHRRRTRALRSRTAVVGAGVVGQELLRLLDEHREYGLEPVGLVDDVPEMEAARLLGPPSDLPAIVTEHKISRLIVAFGPIGEQELVSTLRISAHLPVEVYVVPRFFELGLAPTGSDVDEVWGIPLYRIRRAALQEDAYFVKRVIDITVASVALVTLAPLIAVLALLVRVSSPGPVLFRQERIGQHGRPIDVLKFRSMRDNDDSDTQWSVGEDPRLTRVGRALRRTSLDEIPQLWNVLRGDMSLIGPRPERPTFVDRFTGSVSGYGDRHRLPVGLTGLAQVRGLRGDTSIAERSRFDNHYIEHWTPWLDCKVVLRTFGAVVRDALSGAPTSPPPRLPRRRSRRRARTRGTS